MKKRIRLILFFILLLLAAIVIYTFLHFRFTGILFPGILLPLRHMIVFALALLLSGAGLYILLLNKYELTKRIAVNSISVVMSGIQAKKYGTAIVLGGLIVVSVLIKIPIILDSPEPILFFDEYYYKQNALTIFHLTEQYTSHYPPLYSLVLSPAFFAGRHFFIVMQVINAFIASAGVVPMYFLGRHFKLPLTHNLWACVLFLLLPVHMTFTGMLMSESLYITLFMITFYFCIKPFGNSKKQILIHAATIGFFTSLLFLTRYISLALIPIILLHTLFKVLYFERETVCDAFQSNTFGRVVKILLSLTCFLVLPVLLWLITNPEFAVQLLYRMLHYIPIAYTPDISAADAAARGRPFDLRFSNFMIWIGLYISYAIWMLLPSLPIMLQSLKMTKADALNKKYGGALVLSLLLSTILILTSTLHSFLADYNYSGGEMVPGRIHGRYILYIAPLMILWAFVLVNEFKQSKSMQTKMARVLFIGTSSLVLILSYLLNFSDIIVAEAVPGFFFMDHISTELFLYTRLDWLRIGVLMLGIFSILLFFSGGKNQNKSKISLNSILILISISMVSYFIAFNAAPQFRQSYTDRIGLTMEIFAELDNSATYMMVDHPRENDIPFLLRFWDTSSPAEVPRFGLGGRFDLRNNRNMSPKEVRHLLDESDHLYLITSIPLYMDSSEYLGSGRVFFTRYPVNTELLTPDGLLFYNEFVGELDATG